MTLVIFWASLASLVWTWVGYPLMVLLLVWCRGLRHNGFEPRTSRIEDVDNFVTLSSVPFITVIVAIHDEEAALPSKLLNCLEFDYPDGRYEILVASDGSRDDSLEIVRGFSVRHPFVRLVESRSRIGKSAVQNLAANASSGDIVMLTDVDARLSPDALWLISRRLRQPFMGCVSGRVLFRADGQRRREQSENLYWRFEHGLWRCEDLLGALVWASGPCMAVRRELFRPIDPQYGDDVVVPLDVIGQGMKVTYEPALLVLENCPDHSAMALKARSRMTMRSLAATLSRRAVYYPWRRPGLFITVVSHKLLRWTTPFSFMALLICACLLSLAGQPVARSVVALQLAGLAAAAIGRFAQPFGGLPIAGAAYELTLENLGVLIGVMRFVFGDRQVAYPTSAGTAEGLQATASSPGQPPRTI